MKFNQKQAESKRHAGGSLESMAADPTILMALSAIVAGSEPSTKALSSFVEQDIVLSLKVISQANKMMQSRSTQAIPVHQVSHALSLIGLHRAVHIIQQTLSFQAVEQGSNHGIAYECTLAKTQLLKLLIQRIAVLQPRIRMNEAILYLNIFMLAPVQLAQQQALMSKTLWCIYQRDCLEFWDAEKALLQDTLIHRAIALSSEYYLPEKVVQYLKQIPDFSQFDAKDAQHDIAVLQHFFRSMLKQQHSIVPVVLICIILVNRSPFFWGDRKSHYLVHWLSRFSKQPVAIIWQLLQDTFITSARQIPSLESVGRSVLAQGWPVCLQGADIDICLAQYRAPQVQNEPEVLVPVKIGNGIYDFIATLTQNPQAYGAKFPSAAALLEVLRIHLGLACCIAIFHDKKSNIFSIGSVSGLASRHSIRQWTVALPSAGFLQHFLKKAVSIWITDEKRAAVLQTLPSEVAQLIGLNQAFMCTTQNSQHSTTGVILAIAQVDTQLSKQSFQAFQRAVLITPL